MATDDEKLVWQGAAQRRRENGIRLKRVCFAADESQVEAFNLVWEAWIERWTKKGAVDRLILMMCRAEARLRDAENVQKRP